MADNELRQFMHEVRANHLEMAKALGRLEQGQESLKDLKIGFENHEKDDGAHGIRTLRRVFGGAITALGVAIPLWEIFKRK